MFLKLYFFKVVEPKMSYLLEKGDTIPQIVGHQTHTHYKYRDIVESWVWETFLPFKRRKSILGNPGLHGQQREGGRRTDPFSMTWDSFHNDFIHNPLWYAVRIKTFISKSRNSQIFRVIHPEKGSQWGMGRAKETTGLIESFGCKSQESI